MQSGSAHAEPRSQVVPLLRFLCGRRRCHRVAAHHEGLERYFDPNNLKYFSLCVDAAWVWLQTFQLWSVQVSVALWALAVAAADALGGARAAPGDRLRARPARTLPGLTIYKREDSTAIAPACAVCANPCGGIDLGFNFYNGDYTKEARRAQLDKFEHAWAKLGLKEGMRVLDCGCGMGDWMHWLKDETKCTVVGVNVTLAHALVVRGRGMRCIHSDWQTLFRDDAQFDELRGQVRGAQFCRAIRSRAILRRGIRRRALRRPSV